VDFDAKLIRLRKYNLLMGLIHLVQAVLMLALSNDYSVPIDTSFLKEVPGVENTFESVRETVVHLRMAPLVAGFSFLSAIAHFAVASPWLFGWYANNLRRGINYARWYEYALSASLMTALIAMLAGIYDIVALMGLFALTAAMNLFGLMMELHNQTTQRTNWTAYYLGCFAGIVPWIGISIYFVGAGADGSIPTFVYFIYGSLLFLYTTFAVNMLLQYKKVGPWRDYLFGEAVYIFLSLTAKSLLAWQIFAGALARSN